MEKNLREINERLARQEAEELDSQRWFGHLISKWIPLAIIGFCVGALLLFGLIDLATGY